MHVITVNMSCSVKTATEVPELTDLRAFRWLCIAKPIFVIYHIMLTARVLGNALFYKYIYTFFTLKKSPVYISDILDTAQHVVLFLQTLAL